MNSKRDLTSGLIANKSIHRGISLAKVFPGIDSLGVYVGEYRGVYGISPLGKGTGLIKSTKNFDVQLNEKIACCSA